MTALLLHCETAYVHGSILNRSSYRCIIKSFLELRVEYQRRADCDRRKVDFRHGNLIYIGKENDRVVGNTLKELDDEISGADDRQYERKHPEEPEKCECLLLLALSFSLIYLSDLLRSFSTKYFNPWRDEFSQYARNLFLHILLYFVA